jgi:uncharacterized membrane protein
MVLRNCPKSPTGKHIPAGPVIKGTYIFGILVGIVIGIIELVKYLNIPEKIMGIFNTAGDKISFLFETLKNILK